MEPTVDSTHGSPEGCTDRTSGRMLAAYEWDLLTSDEEQAFETHLLTCDACARELADASPVSVARRAGRSARRRIAWLPLGAAAAAAGVLLFSQAFDPPSRELADALQTGDTMATPNVRQASVTFELSVPHQNSFTYQLHVPGAG